MSREIEHGMGGYAHQKTKPYRFLLMPHARRAPLPAPRLR